MAGDPDFGTDLDFQDDLDPAGRLVSGTKLLGQAAYHRLITPRGACLDSPDDGLDLHEYLSKGLTPTELATIPGEVRLELLKDERFIGADIGMTNTPDGFDLKIRITPSAGPDFELVLSVGEAAVKLLSLAEVQ